MADVMVIMLEESEDVPGDLLDALLLNLLRKAVGHKGGKGAQERGAACMLRVGMGLVR